MRWAAWALLLAKTPRAQVKTDRMLVCMSGDPGRLCDDHDFTDWEVVRDRFDAFEMLIILDVHNSSDCDGQTQRIQIMLRTFIQKDVDVECVYKRDIFQKKDVEMFHNFILEKGWYMYSPLDFTQTSQYYLQQVESQPARELRSTVMQFAMRQVCFNWVTNLGSYAGKNHETTHKHTDWVMSTRMEIQWRSFPGIDSLRSHYPLIWTHARSVEAIAPHRSDRCYVGEADIMKQLLGTGMKFLTAITEMFSTPEDEDLFRQSCLPRRGVASFTCTHPSVGNEDWLEAFFLQNELPVRMHRNICFDLRASRHELRCENEVIENNCDSPALHSSLSHPYTRDDSYDSLLAIQLHRLMLTESLNAGRSLRFIDVGAGVGTYVQFLGRIHPHVWGMDNRQDFNDLIGEQAIFHDFRWRLPSVYRHHFDWAFSINVFDSLNGSVEAIRSWFVTINDLARHGLVIHIPAQYTDVLDKFGEMGFHREPKLELRIRAGSGLLCCRDIARNMYVLTRGLERLYTPLCCPDDRGGFSLLDGFSHHIGDFTTHNIIDGARGDIAAEDWLDTQVPGTNIIWHPENQERPVVDERLAEILFLKFFRLGALPPTAFQKEVMDMDIEWTLYRSLQTEFDLHCAPVDVPEQSSNVVNRFCGFVQGSVLFFELISSRLICQNGCGPPPTSESVLGAAPCRAVSISQFPFAQASTFVTAMGHLFEIRNYNLIYRACQVFHGRQTEWPPVEYIYTLDYRSLVSVRFARTQWGKYLFRVNSLVGAYD
jgi:hypothetical protein